MKRALVLLLTVAAVAAGCGSSAGSSSSSGGSTSGGSSSVSTDTAAGVLAAASAATKDATSAAFDAKLGVTITGNLQGAGAGAALLRGPITLDFKGHAGKGANGKPKFDVDFAFNYTGGSVTGKALSPDGKVLYLQLPALMGPGWHSTPLTEPVVGRIVELDHERGPGRPQGRGARPQQVAEEPEPVHLGRTGHDLGRPRPAGRDLQHHEGEQDRRHSEGRAADGADREGDHEGSWIAVVRQLDPFPDR